MKGKGERTEGEKPKSCTGSGHIRPYTDFHPGPPGRDPILSFPPIPDVTPRPDRGDRLREGTEGEGRGGEEKRGT